jgi:hypothetical protein
MDIGSTLDSKAKAVKAGRSRIADRSDEEIDDFIRLRGQEGVGDSGGNYGEAFRKITFRT